MKVAILALLLLAPRETILRVSWAPPAQLDPQRATSLAESRCIAAMFEGLTTPGPDGVTAAPGMAKTWETSADGLTWTFPLRDAAWSDGEPVVAADFDFAWRRALRPETGCEFVNLFRVFRNVGAWLDAASADAILAQVDDLAKGAQEEALRTLSSIARKRHAAALRRRGALEAAKAADARPDVEEKDLGFEAAGAKTFRVRLEKRTPWLPDLLAFMSFAPVPPKAVAAHGEAWVRPGRIATNGPYLFDAATGVSLVFKKNPAYWDKALAEAPDTVAVELSSEEVALEKFRARKLDWLPREQIPAAKLAEQKDLVAYDAWGTHFLRFNAQRAPFNVKEARVAAARGIDRREVAKVAGAKSTERLVPAGFPGYPEVAPLGFDKAAAMEALLKATEFDLSKFPRVEILTNGSPKSMTVGNAVADQLEKTLAIKVRVRSMKWPAYVKAMAEGDYQIALGSWMGDYFDPAAFLEGWSKAGGGGMTGWTDERFDALLGEAAAATDAKARLELLAQAEAKLLGSAVVAPLYAAGDAYLVRDGVSGLTPNLLSRFPLKYVRVAPK
jgi:oligopeptide transport system substrate-binding protein